MLFGVGGFLFVCFVFLNDWVYPFFISKLHKSYACFASSGSVKVYSGFNLLILGGLEFFCETS